MINSEEYNFEEDITEEFQKIEEYEKKEEELRNAHSISYKNILWIDDRDDNDGASHPLDWMKNYCDESTCMQIEQVDSFYDAVKEILENSSKYDLVIFDINLKNSFPPISQKAIDYIQNCFSDYHILFTYNGIDRNYAGFYLFKLLLHVGYPLNRMLIFSAHSTQKKAQEELNGLIIDDRIFIKKNNGEKLDIEKKFFAIGEHDYYRVRRLVYQACNYWISKLKKSEWVENPYNIPFNKIYYDKPNNPLKVDNFVGMLELVKMLFPVSAPQENQKPKTTEQENLYFENLYFKALQSVVSFHEESAEIKRLGTVSK